MGLINLKKVNDHDVIEWLESHIRNLTSEQKKWIRRDEIVRFAPFYFMEKRKKVDSILLRFSIIFILPILLILIIGLPFNFLITGSWGYDEKKLKWYSKWLSACAL